MKIFLIILGIVITVFLILLVITHFIVKMIVNPKRYTRNEQKDYNKKKNYDKGTSILKRTPIQFEMEDGYIIHGDYSLYENSKKFCILVHGHGTSREGALRYSLIFHELGYSTIIYDQRSHGDNIWNTVSMGYYESKDLNRIIELTYLKFGKDICLGLQGTSMGGATCLLALNDKQNIKFCVSDCSYATFKSVLHDTLLKYHLLPFIFIPLVNISLKLFYKWSLKDASPITNVKKTSIPILFIHGDKDTYVKVDNAKLLYESTNSKKELWIVSGASHAESITIDRNGYKAHIKEFLEKEDN